MFVPPGTVFFRSSQSVPFCVTGALFIRHYIMKHSFRFNFIFTTILALIILHSTSCDKNPVMPAVNMHYTDLHNMEVKLNDLVRVDLDQDGVNDIRFSTVLVGDPILKTDYHQLTCSTIGNEHTPVNSNNETPALAAGASISANAFPGYPWNYALVILTQKVEKDGAPSYWDGNWKDASHRHLAIRINRDNHSYYGWLELSFDSTEEKLVLHRAGFSTSPDTEIKAGM